MTNYGASIQLADKMTPILNNIITSLDMTISTVYDMQSSVDGFDASGLDSIRETLAQAESAHDSLVEKLKEPVSMPQPETPEPVTWTSSNFDVFTDTGTDRFTSEIQSAVDMINRLNTEQRNIAENSANTKVFSKDAVLDMVDIGNKMTYIQNRILQIESNPANPLDPNASNELESLRQKLSQALDYQQQMNAAVDDLDVSRANQLYHQLNNIVNQTEQEIRDNVDAQGQFNNRINQSISSANTLSGTFSKIASGLGLYKIGSELMETASAAVEFASDLTEVQNVVDVTFSSASATVDEWATNTLDAFGINELSAKQYAGTMGAMLKSSGVAGDAVAEMSTSIAELSGDMASFYNLDGDEAFNKIRSGISGETEPLKQLGINMSVANLEAYALSQGIETAYSEMSQGEQVMLRYNYLLSATADAQGDFARTSDSYSNQTKLLSENWTAFTGEIASYVIPKLTEIIQSVNNLITKMQPYTEQIAFAFGVIVDVAGSVIDSLANGAAWIAENWSIISPILGGVATAIGFVALAYGVYNGVQMIHNIQTQIEAVQKYKAAQAALKHSAGLTAEKRAMHKATIAQSGFNTAMLASPVTWIILALIALVAVIFVVINAVNKATGSTTSAIDVILGALCAFGAFLLNLVIGVINSILQFIWRNFVEPFIGIIEWILNVCNGGFDSFGGAVANLIGNIISWFLSLGKIVTTIIDAIFGTDWTSGLSSLQDTVLAWGKTDNAITLSRDAPQIDYRMEYSDAYDWGYTKGDSLSDKVANMFSFENELENSALTETAENTGSIASTTQDISDKVSASSDDELEWLRKIAERETVNRFTTAEIKLDVQSNATINSDIDIDGFINTFTEELSEVLVTTAEGLEE